MVKFQVQIDEELILRQLRDRDAEALFSLVEQNRGYLRAWLPWADETLTSNDSRDFIRQSNARFSSKNGLAAGLWYRGTLAGVMGLGTIDWRHKSTSIGYWVGAQFQGKGLTTRACRALVNYAFQDLGLNRVEIRCAVQNTKSRAIPERLGFQQEGILRQVAWNCDHFEDHVIYGMLAEEWDSHQ